MDVDGDDDDDKWNHTTICWLLTDQFLASGHLYNYKTQVLDSEHSDLY